MPAQFIIGNNSSTV